MKRSASRTKLTAVDWLEQGVERVDGPGLALVVDEKMYRDGMYISATSGVRAVPMDSLTVAAQYTLHTPLAAPLPAQCH